MNFYDKYIHAGKKMAFFFYLKAVFFNLIPRWWLLRRRERLLRGWEKRPDADYIRRRVEHYNIIASEFSPGDDSLRIKDLKIGKFSSRYLFDLLFTLRYFPKHYRLRFQDYDVIGNPQHETLMKCRRLTDINTDKAVILNLDSIRHYLNPHDTIPFEKKIPKLLFRGEIYGKPERVRFFEMWADNAMFDLGDTEKRHPSRWQKPVITVPDHFRYQFILTLEGNDMASALQWVMASNCVPVMPKPTVEGWLMHSQMKPGVHYIEIKPDYSDVAEKIEYYIAHPDEARKISEESKKWGRQFLDKKREKIISLLVAEKYFRLSRQITSP